MLVSSLSFALIQISVNDYYDFETQTSSGSLNDSHDVRCTSYAYLTPVNDARGMLNSTGGNAHPDTNLTNVIGGVWNQDAVRLKIGIGSPQFFGYFVTTEWNYTKIYSAFATAGKCEFDIIQVGITPYFEGTSEPGTYEITLASWTIDNLIYISMYDLGLMPDNLVGTSLSYQLNTNELWAFNSTAFYESTDTDSSTTRMVEAQCFIPEAYGRNNFSEINNPPGYYDVFCWNTTFEERPFTGAVMVLTNTPVSGSLRLIRFNQDYFTIIDTDHTPDYPTQSMPVTVTWGTTQTANSRLYYRSAPTSNTSNTTGWSSRFIDDDLLEHSIIINGSYIIDNRFYQYWVESNRTGTVINDTNSGIFYNFTVGVIILPGTVNDTAPFPKGLESVGTIIGVGVVDMLYIGSIFMILILSIGGFLASKKPELGVAIAVTGLVLFSVFGWIPYYIFPIIAIIFSIALAVMIKKMVM